MLNFNPCLFREFLSLDIDNSYSKYLLQILIVNYILQVNKADKSLHVNTIKEK